MPHLFRVTPASYAARSDAGQLPLRSGLQLSKHTLRKMRSVVCSGPSAPFLRARAHANSCGTMLSQEARFAGKAFSARRSRKVGHLALPACCLARGAYPEKSKLLSPLFSVANKLWVSTECGLSPQRFNNRRLLNSGLGVQHGGSWSQTARIQCGGVVPRSRSTIREAEWFNPLKLKCETRVPLAVRPAAGNERQGRLPMGYGTASMGAGDRTTEVIRD